MNLPANDPLYMTRWPGSLLAGTAVVLVLWDAIPIRARRPPHDEACTLARLALPWCALFLLLAVWDGGRCSFPMNLLNGHVCDTPDHDYGTLP